MGLGGFLKDLGGGVAKGINATANALNYVDRLGGYNPFHQEPGSASEADKAKYNGPIGNTLSHTVEEASKGINWVYDNGISQPISTALMAGMLKGGPFTAHNWSQAWHAANHISPAQALFLNSSQTQQAVNSPLKYYKPPDANLPPGFNDLPEDQQQKLLKDAGMPAIGNAYIDELRQSSAVYRNATGITDFALRWEADPVVMGGKVIGGARREIQVVKRPLEGWSKADIDKIMAKSTMVKAQDYIFANLDNPAKLNNLSMARNSAMGPRFGAIASTLRTRDEVGDFLRVSMGDINALEKLEAKNAAVAARLEQDTARLPRLGLKYTAYADNPNLQALIERQMDRLNQQINADTRLVNSYDQVIKNAHKLDQVNLSRWSFARADQRTEAQAAYRARAARGSAARPVTITPTPLLSRGTATPVDLGIAKGRIYGAGDFFSTPVTVVRAFANARPNGYMRVDDIDQASIAELRGQIARIPGISNETRLNMLNQYLKTTGETERVKLLTDIGRTGAAKVAMKHGMTAQDGLDIYKAHLTRQYGEVDRMKRYSAALKPVQLENGELARVHVDEFADDSGKLVLHPNLVTRLANDHVFQDLDEMDKILARHSSALKAIRTSTLGNADWISNSADYLTTLFKFGTLFRLGYIPRVLSDDLAGQWARLGSAAMAMRLGWGVRNGATNTALWLNRPFEDITARSAQAGADMASDLMRGLEPEMAQLKQSVATHRAVTRADITQAGRRLASAKAKKANLSPNARPATRAALDKLIVKHERDLNSAVRNMTMGGRGKVIRLRDLEAHHGWLDSQRAERQATADAARAKANAPRVHQGDRPVDLGNGVTAPAAFAGNEGEYYQMLNGSDKALGQIFATNKQLIHGHLMRSFDHGGKSISAAQDEALHAQSWAHAINHQLVQDPLARQAIQGANPQQMIKWLDSTAQGRLYMQRLGLKMTRTEEVANSAWYDVAEYMPTPEIRLKALEEGGVTPQFLKDSMPMAQRPEVHTGQVGQTQVRYKRALDDIQRKWFRMAAEIPANRMSRHPLFNQLYEGHLTSIKNTLMKQGAYDTTVDGVNKMASTARSLALRDTRKYVFDIAHRSDASAAMRFIMPFMTATNESFQRWGRIIADKPQTIGYGAIFFNAPAAMGGLSVGGLHLNGAQDADGNTVDRNGYAYTLTYPINPLTGRPDYTKKPTRTKTLVPKSQRYIVGRMPSWVAKSPLGTAFGMEPSSGNFKLSQNSMNLVTQGDPFFSPGFGPIVQIPVNELVKDKPGLAEMARHLDVLPFGPQQGTGLLGNTPLGRAAGFVIPATVKNFLTAYDTSDERYQQVKLQILQRAIYEHTEMGKPMPSAAKIASMVKQYWMFSAASAFLQPMATQKTDAYQFYRDQYNALRRSNPLTADQEFLDRFGESYFIFAQAQSKNASGIPSTRKAVELSQKYADLIAANPELGALIVGPEGNGPFSPEAYSYQLNTPLTPGGSEMQRTKISADEALAENQRRLGWAKYTTMINRLTAELHNRGLASFNDDGAEDLKQEKSNYTQLYSQPLYPDGTPNPFYNAEWSKDYSALDPLKYDRLIPGLTAVANSPLAKEPNRSDLRVLQEYLGGRKAVLNALQERYAAGGNKTLGAQSNADLAQQWGLFVDGLIESDTRFGDLHSRYLARDLGYDGSEQEAA